VGKHAREATETSREQPITLAVGVNSPRLTSEPKFYFEEFSQLLKTAGVEPDHTLYINLRSIDRAYFFTKGKLQDLVEFCEKNNVEMVVISDLLSPLQERNLQDMLGCKVFSRSELILEIFQQAAHSSEGKIQVEMAYLEHLKTRMSGRGKELAQQEGVVGSRGPGETAKEQLRRYYTGRLRQAKKKLAQVAKSRATQRKQRLKRGIPLVSLVGYTNAGKSSILNTMTKSSILAEDKLFATLDTTTRELFLSQEKKVLLSDTVGFISNLPHQLIEAFKSTLDELSYATTLLHVIDSSNPAWKDQALTVAKTLKELDAKAPVIHVFNKMDILSQEEKEQLVEDAKEYEPCIFVSAQDKAGVSPLFELLQKGA